MGRLFKFCFIALLFFSTSCKDNDYNFDDINKDVFYNIPRIPFISQKFSLDEIFDIAELDPYLPNSGVIEIPPLDKKIAGDFVINNIFDNDATSKFFHPYMTNDFVIHTVFKASFMERNDVSWILDFDILDANNREVTGLEIQDVVVNTNNSEIAIVIPKESYKAMENAKHIRFNVSLQFKNFHSIKVDDYVVLEQIFIQTGGLFTNL